MTWPAGPNGLPSDWARRRATVLAAHHRRCHICGHGDADQVDHIIPRAERGTDNLTNLAPAHHQPCPVCRRRCHLVKTQAESRAGKTGRKRPQPPHPGRLPPRSGQAATVAARPPPVGGGSRDRCHIPLDVDPEPPSIFGRTFGQSPVSRNSATAPAGLAAGGRTLWRAVVKVGPLRGDRVRVLEDACREADLIDELVAELKGAPKLVMGSMRQQVANPLISEVRQHRAVLSGLLRALDLPESDPGAGDAMKAREAAMALNRVRWSKKGSS